MTTPTPTPLNLKNIQGDIVQGLPKKFEEFVFFQITDPILFRKELQAIVPLITTMAQVKEDIAAISEHKKNPASGYPEKLHPVSGSNIAFSHFGLAKMNITDDLGDGVFTSGQKMDASNLGDVIKTVGGVPTPDWDPTFLQPIDGVLLITGESKASVDARRVKLEAALKSSIKVIETLSGNVRPGKESGHEHFGFQDGISQPAIKGFVPPFTGQLAIDSGFVICGGDNDPVANRSAFAKDGSFLAFRKLRQLVPEFEDFLLKNGTGFDGLGPKDGAEFFGARLFGRWKSGAPIDIAPVKDDPVLAKDPNRNNDFHYSFTNPDDQTDQTRCPFSAHVRKTFPRDDIDKGATTRPSDSRRIIRNGIPYGPEVTPSEQQSKTTSQHRGLAFVAYQSVIANGFQFIQHSWANNTKFHLPGVGFDPIIGANNMDPSRDRQVSGVDPKNQSGNIVIMKDFIESRGGEYFFSPSISTLRDLIATK